MRSSKMKSQKAKPLTRLYFISPILLLALVLGISGQVFCAEIDHYYKSHDALITKSCSNGTWQEVTEYQIDSSNFAAGKKYLIVINFSINTGLDNNQNAMVRVLHGSTPFPDSTYRNETRRNNGAHVGHGYQYWTVWTALSGEDIHIEVTQPTATSVTVRTEEYEAVVMNLEDGLTENTDWFYQTETHSGNLPTSWGVAPGIGASITFDGGGNDWMILAFGHFVHDATTGKYLMRVYDVTDVAAYSQVWHRAVDVDDYRPHMLMIGLTNAGSSHTVRVEARNNTSGVIHDWDYSKIFALNLNKFKDHWTGYSTTAVSLAVLDTWYEVYGKPDYAASQAGNALIWSQEIADVGEATKSIYSRMTLNGLVVPTGHSDAKRELPHGDADETAHHRIYLGSVNAGSNDIDIDMNEDIDVSPAGIIDIHSLCIFSMEKAAFCPTPGTPGSPTPADGVTGQSIDVDLDWSDCTDTDSYDVYFGTSASPPLYASDVAISNYTLPTLEYCTKYYWKIKAKNAGGCSTTGPIWDFTTENGPPRGYQALRIRLTARQGCPRMPSWTGQTVRVRIPMKCILTKTSILLPQW
jgi:hypothetical protein